MRAGEPALGRRLEPPGLSEVDRRPFRAEQLADPVDRGLEGVGERELCDRLSHDREQRLAPLELLREVARALAQPHGVGGTGPERREPRELVGAGLVSRLKDETQAADRWLAEPDEHDTVLERHAAVSREQLVPVSHRRGRIREIRRDSGRRHRLRSVVRAPEDARACARRFERQPGDALPAPRLLRDHRERAARDLERRASDGRRRLPVGRVDRTNEQRGVACDHPGEQDVALRERLTCPRQLERRDHACFRAYRTDQDVRRAPPPGEPADRRRHVVVLGQLVRPDRVRVDA